MSIDTDYKVLRTVLENHNWFNGWAVEFGVYSGYSLNLIAGHMPVIGFDSFEGLPEDWRPGFPKGTFSAPPIAAPGNAMIVPGLFSDTVPTFPFPELELVHIDCDLYSSTVTALEAITPRVSAGTIIVFDEYEGMNEDGSIFDDEKRAFNEWLGNYNINADLVLSHEQEAAFRIESIP